MIRVLYIAWVFLFFSPHAQIGEAQSQFQSGNELYKQGQYLEALGKYQAALATGYTSPELYYNLGNTYYKLDDIAHSILYLERAKKLAPHDPDIAFNLEMVNLRVVDKIPVAPPFILDRIYAGLRDTFSLGVLGRITMWLYFIFIVLLVGYILLRRAMAKLIFKYTLVIMLIFLVGFTWVFVDRVNRDLNHQYGIVLTEKIDIMSSPASDATQVFVLHEGVKVRVTAKSGDFVKIELPDGKIGWLKSAAIDVI